MQANETWYESIERNLKEGNIYLCHNCKKIQIIPHIISLPACCGILMVKVVDIRPEPQPDVPKCTCMHGKRGVAIESEDNQLPTPSWKCPVHGKKIEKLSINRPYDQRTINLYIEDKVNELIERYNGEKK